MILRFMILVKADKSPEAGVWDATALSPVRGDGGRSWTLVGPDHRVRSRSQADLAGRRLGYAYREGVSDYSGDPDRGSFNRLEAGNGCSDR